MSAIDEKVKEHGVVISNVLTEIGKVIIGQKDLFLLNASSWLFWQKAIC